MTSAIAGRSNSTWPSTSFGTYGVTQAFLSLLTRSQGAIVNVGSLSAWAAVPVFPAYSISKAAAFSRPGP
ncbi:MAG: short-chain dehydrogenase [Actinomycetia bacterium]|nr:short-chain dehydrogenase [Actinomycetes bacterium]